MIKLKQKMEKQKQQMTQIYFKRLHKDVILPKYETNGAACMDLRVYFENKYSPFPLYPGERKLFKTGLQICLPSHHEAQIRSRSGLSYKHGIALVNGVGTIDEDYRGEICIPLINLSNVPYFIKHNDRVAQMKIAEARQVSIGEVFEIDETERNSGGFGHTGRD